MRQQSSGDGRDKIADPVGWDLLSDRVFCVYVEIQTISRGWEVVRVWRGGEILVVLEMEHFFSGPGGTHHIYAVLNDRRGR